MVAGTVSTVLFTVSMLPMLVKAARTKDLASYSLGNLLLGNLANAVHSFYVFSLPPGPIWLLHVSYVLASALMLAWCLRYRHAPGGPAHDAGIHDAGIRDAGQREGLRPSEELLGA